MPSSKQYLEYVLEQLSDLDEISYRAMMGEYIIYYRGKIVGGIYDDRFLVKPVKSAMSMMSDASMELPYDGAKEMILKCMMSFRLREKENNGRNAVIWRPLTSNYFFFKLFSGIEFVNDFLYCITVAIFHCCKLKLEPYDGI